MVDRSDAEGTAKSAPIRAKTQSSKISGHPVVLITTRDGDRKHWNNIMPIKPIFKTAPVAKSRALARKHRNLAHMENANARRVLFVCLLDHLSLQKPRVRVTESLIEVLDDLVARILKGEYIAQEFGLWGQIWEAHRRKAIESRDTVFCGVNLLQFFGHLGEELQNQGDRKLSLDVAIETLILLQGEKEVIKMVFKHDRRWIEPTRHGERVLGLTGRMDLSMAIDGYDIPQQLLPLGMTASDLF